MHVWTSMLVDILMVSVCVGMVCYRKICGLASEQGWLCHCETDKLLAFTKFWWYGAPQM